MTHFYAIYLPYGQIAINSNGNQANRLYAFPTKQARDHYIAADELHRIWPSDSLVRRVRRDHLQNGATPATLDELLTTDGVSWFER